MKTVRILLLAVVFAFSLNAHAAEANPERAASNADQPPVCQKLIESGATQEKLAEKGCCSWHGGVCGCSGGHATCCDGKLSPSCGCNKVEIPQPS